MKPHIDPCKYPPAHPVCSTIVEVPIVRLQPKGHGYPDRPAAFEGREEMVLQWFGDGDLGGFQFAFPLQARPDAPFWFGHPEWYRVAMIGPLSKWPNPAVIGQFTQSGQLTPESPIVYLITGNIGLDNQRGGTIPSARLIPIIMLGDPVHGVIRPKDYDNPKVVKEEFAKVNGGRNA